MALKIVTGGTTGAADGTLVSSGNPLVIVALNTAVDAHIRCDDGYWSSDQHFDVPAELEVSFDGGSTWYDNADEPITAPEIEDVNYPIKIRQTTAAASASGSFVTDGTYTAIAALSTPTLTATVISDTQIDLSWTNVSNEDASPGYTLERSTAADFSANLVTVTKAANVTTHSATGLTTGTHYYFRVKAEGSGRYSDSGWGTDDDTPSLANVTGFAAAVSSTTVNLSWNAVSGAHHYTIEWGTDGVTYGNTITDQTGTTYAHTGRSANTVYYYRIKAHLSDHSGASGSWATCYAGVQILIYAANTKGLRSASAVFATARAGSGTVTDNGGTTDPQSCVVQNDSGTYQVDRAYMQFTTSGGVIPAAATIDEGWLRLTNTTNYSSPAGWSIYKGTYSNSPPATSDFGSVTVSDLGGPTSNPATNTPTDYAITSPDSNIEKNGTARLVLVERTRDFGNSAPGVGVFVGNAQGGPTNATTDRRPQLKVSFHG